MSENTREIVLDTLLALEAGEDFSHRLVKAVLDKYDYLDSRDKAFIKRVTEGTIERKIELDYYLNRFSSVPVKKMKPLIRCLLRMSVYQILYMDAVPDSSVCNEACKLAGKRRFTNLKGFVNGVLRSIARQKEGLSLPDEGKDPGAYLSVKYSMPRWILEKWLEEYGKEITVTLLEGLLRIHPVQIRFSTRLSAQEREACLAAMTARGARAAKTPYLPCLYQVEAVGNPAELPGFARGDLTVQDTSSALAVEAAGITREDFVVDICAAPGGKTMFAAEKAREVLARDVSEQKISLIEENLARMRLSNVRTQVFDARERDDALVGKADVLLMDVPCSGLGVLGRKRDIKYHVTPKSLACVEKLQKEIVESSWQYVKPGGVLIYSTCTINRAENEDMVRYITENFPFEPEDLTGYLPKELLAQKRPDRKLTKEEAAACIQLLPGIMETDGFFIARFRRK